MKSQNQIRFRSLIYEQFARNVSETAAFDLLRSKFGSITTLSEIKKWYEKFRNGDTTLTDEDGTVGRQFIGINELVKVQNAYIDEFQTCCFMTSFAVEGRFVITNNYRHAHIIDLCHSQLRELEYDFSSFFPTDSKKDPKNDPNVIYNVLNIFLVDLKSVLLCYYEHKDREEYQHLSFGEVDLENSRIIVHSPIHLPHQQVLMQVVGQTQESNLTDGVLAYCACEDYEHGLLQMITLDQNKELHAKTVLELPSPIMIYGLIGGHVYGFKMNEKYWKDYEKLLVISIATGEKFELKTTNCDLLGKQPKHCYDDKLVCIGKKMFMTRPFRDENKSRLFSLNLETYQWTNTGIEFEDRGYFLHTDAERTLIVSKWRMGRPEPIRPFYRFSVKPDLLQNLVWLAIKRRSDYDPSFYSHIIGQLPKKSKFRCPFFPLTEEEADRLANYN